MEPHELQQALTTFGYRLTPQTLAVLNSRYSSNGKVGFDDFVALCIKLRALTCEYKYLYAAIIFLTHLSLCLAHFQARDTMRNGTATFQYDDVGYTSSCC